MIKVCLISCWYQNVSLANYSYDLKKVLDKYDDVNVNVVSSHCACFDRYNKENISYMEKCNFINCPHFHLPISTSRISNKLNYIIRCLVNFYRGFAFLKRSYKCDIIHYQQSNSYSFGFFPLLSMILMSSKKKIVTLHSLDTIQERFKILIRIYNYVENVIVHSEDMRKLLKNNGVFERKIFNVFHGVKIPPIYDLNRTEITFLGAPEERKGILTVLNALQILKNKNIKVFVSIYGIYSGEEKIWAEKEAELRGIKNHLIWGGRLSEEDFDKKLQESLFTFAVYPYPVSGSSIVLRAMSNATPVIASDIGGIKEYLNGGGIFIPPDNHKKLADVIESLLQNSLLREGLGTNGRQRAINYFAWDRVGETTINIYKQIMSAQEKE